MPLNVDFFDSFDTWSGIDPKPTVGEVAPDSPWHADYGDTAGLNDIVDTVAGALKIGSQDRAALIPRVGSNLNRDYWNLDAQPSSITLGFKLALGNAADYPMDTGGILLNFRIVTNTGTIDSAAHPHLQYVLTPKREVICLWASASPMYHNESTGLPDEDGVTGGFPYSQLHENTTEATTALLVHKGVIVEVRDYLPTLYFRNYDDYTLEGSASLPGIATTIHGIAKNVSGSEVFVLAADKRIHVYDANYAATGEIIDLSGLVEITGTLEAMYYDPEFDMFYVAGDAGIIHRVTRAGAHNKSYDATSLYSRITSITGAPVYETIDTVATGEDSVLYPVTGVYVPEALVITGLSTSELIWQSYRMIKFTETAPSSGLIDTLNNIYAKRIVNDTIGVTPTEIFTVYFDGMCKYESYNPNSLITDPDVDYYVSRKYIHGFPMAYNKFLGDEVVKLSWNTTYRMEHCLRPLSKSGMLEAVKTAGGIATRKIDGAHALDGVIPNSPEYTADTTRAFTGRLIRYMGVDTGGTSGGMSTTHGYALDSIRMDDFYLLSDDTEIVYADLDTVPNDYLGNWNVHVKRPNEAIDIQNIAALDDRTEQGLASLTAGDALEIYSSQYTQNSNTAYMIDGALGAVDTLGLSDVTITGQVVAVAQNIYWRREEETIAAIDYPADGSGAALHDWGIRLGMSRSGVDAYQTDMEFHPDGIFQDTNGIGNLTGNPYRETSNMACKIMATDPFTGVAWTAAGVNDFDYKVRIERGYPWTYPEWDE